MCFLAQSPMKTSQYCIPVDAGAQILCFDSLSKAFILIKKERFKQIYSGDHFLIEELTPQEIDLLKANGFILSRELEQKEIAIAARYGWCLNKKTYHLIINPTMDCNLGCWYCYETHRRGSRISPELVTAVCEHIRYKYLEDKIESLSLGFFGGEPLLATSETCKIISFAKKFCEESNIQMSLHFTSNGTLLSNKLLEVIGVTPATFQITLDGGQQQHDSIRCFKGSKQGSFQLIQNNISKIINSSEYNRIQLRINYDADTFTETTSLESLIVPLNPSRVTLSLHRVWQISQEEINEDALFAFLTKMKRLGIPMNLQGYSLSASICYADRLNSCIVNYNGDVFKCSARDFSTENRCGSLNAQGVIAWKYDRLKEYCIYSVPELCSDCILFPSCPSICSQSIIESKNTTFKCPILYKRDLDEIVLMHYFLSVHSKVKTI